MKEEKVAMILVHTLLVALAAIKKKIVVCPRIGGKRKVSKIFHFTG